MADADLLFAEHQPGVFRYLCRVIGQADAARDLTQEVFLRVSRSAIPASTSDGQRAWVFKIARNLALNHLRDGRRRPRTVELVEQASPAVQELSAAIEEALASLPDVERDVFLMRETAGLSYTEIAASCDLSLDAVRSRLHRARLLLRERLPAPVDAQRHRGVRFSRTDHHDRP